MDGARTDAYQGNMNYNPQVVIFMAYAFAGCVILKKNVS